jgi:integrase
MRCRAIDLPWVGDLIRARKPTRSRVALSSAEVRAVLAELHGRNWLIASWLYGSGLRLMECLRLRAKDVDFRMRHIVVRSGKGDKDRVTVLAEAPRPLAGHRVVRHSTMRLTRFANSSVT